MALRVLTWNLMHGRAIPSAGRDLLEEFATALGGWSWDVALLQEVPPWWPQELGQRLRADHRRVLTSRNALLAVRRAVAIRWPDLIKSNGGGSNGILVREGTIVEHRTLRLCRLPERRSLQAVRMLSPGSRAAIWVGNLHATVHDAPAALRDSQLAAATTLEWAAGEPVVLGGDFNIRRLSLYGLDYLGGHDVDHVFVGGLAGEGEPEVLECGRLSDHAPVSFRVRI